MDIQSLQAQQIATSHIQNDAAQMKKIEDAAQEFEAVFIAEMLKPMFEGIEHDGPFGGGKGEEIFHGMMVEEYGKELARRGDLGIATHIKAEMIRMQAEANGQSSDALNEINTLTHGDSYAISGQ